MNPRRTLQALCLLGAIAIAPSVSQAAGIYYVDNTNPNASDNGPGTPTIPYRTISAAVAARTGAGTTIYVLPGRYPEQVSVPNPGGASENPFVLQGVGSGVVVDGADDFSSTSLWTSVAGDVWLAASVNGAPFQAFADGVRLTPSTVAPASMPAGTFQYVAGQGLYVNAGGGNPGTHLAAVGRRANGFKVSGKSWVTISGFTVTRTEDRGIYVSSNSSNCVVSNNTVTFTYRYGIGLSASTSILVSSNFVSDSQDHGISLSGVCTGCTVQDNESCRNSDPVERRANGIYLNQSSSNVIQRNRLHDNQDTGLQINSFSNNNLSAQNVSYRNGDHGFDHLNNSTGSMHRNDVAFGNYKDGFSIEGGCTGTSVFNCVGIDNGLTVFPREFDLWVDAGSSSGFASDYNLFWNSSGEPPVKFISTVYSTVAAYSAASGNDTHSGQADPRFVNAAAGDFHLLAGSTAIDNATSSASNWPATDANGQPRIDDPATPNAGAGPVPYADRGAFEFAPADSPPIVTAPATVTGFEGVGLALSVAASDPDGDPIASLVADLSALPAGNNAVFNVGPANTAGTLTWTPTTSDGRPAPYNVTFTASNVLTGSSVTAITVSDVDRAPIVSAPASVNAPEGSQAQVLVTASDPDGSAIASLGADLSALPAGHNAAFATGAGNASGTLTWTPTFVDSRPAPYNVTFTASNALTGTARTAITVTNTDRAPVVTAPASVVATPGHRLTVVVTASDPDGQSITSLKAALNRLPKKGDAAFTAGAGNTSGTLTWTPTNGDIRNNSYPVTFTAANARSGTATTEITVRSSDAPPAILAPTTVSGPEASPITFTITSSDADGDPIGSLTANLSALPAGHNATFAASASKTSGTFAWTPTYADGRPTPYNVVFTATNSLSGSATTAVIVTPVDRAPVVSAPPTALVVAGSGLTVVVAASDPDGDAITALTANLAALPAGNDAAFTAGPGNTSGTLTWTPTEADIRATPYSVVFTASNALSGSAITDIRVKNVDHPPSVTASATAEIDEGLPLTLTVAASDPDGDVIAALTADFSGLPASNNAQFTADPSNTSGTFTWTPSYADGGSGPYTVTFTASNDLSGSSATVITVDDVDRAPAVTAPGSLGIPEGLQAAFTVTASDPDGDPIASLTADLSALPAGNNAAFATAGDNSSGSFTWTPATGDARPASYDVTFTASTALSSTAACAITVLPPNQSPVAALSLSPATGNAPLSMTANASGSNDPDGSIVSYRFDFGDGTIVGPQPAATAAHVYAAGSYTATVLVTDNFGATASASAPVIVASVGPGQNWVGNPSFEAATTGWIATSGSTVQRVAGGFDGAYALQVQGPATGTTRFGANDSPNWVASTQAAGTRYRFTAWVRSDAAVGRGVLRVREYLGSVQQGVLTESPLVTLTPTWQMITMDYVSVAGGSTLDFQVLDAPVVPGEVFQTDNISIRIVTGGAAAALAPEHAPGSVERFGAVLAPNPLNPEAVLSFVTTRPGPVNIRVFDVAGRRVRDLLTAVSLPSGRHAVRFDGRDGASRKLASGVYYYLVEAAEGAIRGRMVILK